MQARIQHFGGQVRVWEDHSTPHVDPYEWAAGLNWIDEETVEVVGVDKPMKPGVWEATNNALIDAGAKFLKIVRIRKGVKHERVIPLVRK